MTVGNTARYQLNMAQVQTKYGDQLNQIYKTKYANRYESAAKSLDDLMNSSALKNKSDIFREQFSSLYKNIYGIRDDSSEEESSSVSSSQSVKTASASAGSAAEGMKSMANSLKYGGEIDLDAYKKQAQGFVDSYNTMVDKLSKSDNQAILQKGVLMVNTAKVYSSALNRAGITLGADNKLSLQDDLSKVSATDVKSTFGSHGFSDKVIQKTQQINQLSGGSGFFIPSISSGSTSSSSSDKVNNPIAVKTAASDVEKAASSLKLYLKDIGADGSKEFDSKEYADSAKKFVEGFNKLLDETSKSAMTSVNGKGSALGSVAKAYKYALKRAGINVGSDNKLTIADDIEKKTAADAKYAFGSGSFLDNVTQKAQQASALANSAREMGYNANSTYSYAYNSGALYSVYA